MVFCFQWTKSFRSQKVLDVGAGAKNVDACRWSLKFEFRFYIPASSYLSAYQSGVCGHKARGRRVINSSYKTTSIINTLVSIEAAMSL